MEENHSTMTTRMTSMPMGEWSGTSASSSNAAIDIAIVIADDGSTTTREGVGSTHEAEEDLTTRQGMRGMRRRDRRSRRQRDGTASVGGGGDAAVGDRPMAHHARDSNLHYIIV